MAHFVVYPNRISSEGVWLSDWITSVEKRLDERAVQEHRLVNIIGDQDIRIGELERRLEMARGCNNALLEKVDAHDRLLRLIDDELAMIEGEVRQDQAKSWVLGMMAAMKKG